VSRASPITCHLTGPRGETFHANIGAALRVPAQPRVLARLSRPAVTISRTIRSRFVRWEWDTATVVRRSERLASFWYQERDTGPCRGASRATAGRRRRTWSCSPQTRRRRHSVVTSANTAERCVPYAEVLPYDAEVDTRCRRIPLVICPALAIVACRPFGSDQTSRDAGMSERGVPGAALDGSVSPPPPDLPSEGLVLWLRARDGVAASAEGRVAGWTDLAPRVTAGTPRNAEQPAVQAQPQLVTENGVPAVVFDGSDELQLPPGLDDFTQGLSFFAAVWPRLDTRGTAGAVFSLGLGGSGSSDECGRAAEITFEGFGMHCRVDNQAVGTDSTIDGQGWEIVSVVIGGWSAQATCPASTSIQLRRGNQIRGSGTIYSLNRAVRSPAARLGRSTYFDTQYFMGKIGEVVLYRRALEPSDVTRVTNHLTTGWPR
jgi:hypothetical protein